jgi:hypothetical protein
MCQSFIYQIKFIQFFYSYTNEPEVATILMKLFEINQNKVTKQVFKATRHKIISNRN